MYLYTKISEVGTHLNCLVEMILIGRYPNVPKLSGTDALANNADLDQTAPAPDQGLHCLAFHQQLVDTFLYGKTSFFKF